MGILSLVELAPVIFTSHKADCLVLDGPESTNLAWSLGALRLHAGSEGV